MYPGSRLGGCDAGWVAVQRRSRNSENCARTRTTNTVFSTGATADFLKTATASTRDRWLTGTNKQLMRCTGVVPAFPIKRILIDLSNRRPTFPSVASYRRSRKADCYRLLEPTTNRSRTFSLSAVNHSKEPAVVFLPGFDRQSTLTRLHVEDRQPTVTQLHYKNREMKREPYYPQRNKTKDGHYKKIKKHVISGHRPRSLKNKVKGSHRMTDDESKRPKLTAVAVLR